MKNKFLITLLACFFMAFSVSAQLSKAEAKEWKKKMKSMDVESFKNMVEENSTLKSQVSSMNAQVTAIQGKLDAKNQEVASLESKVRNLEGELSAARKSLENKPEVVEVVDGQIISGVVFKVQIGAYRNMDLSKYFDNNPNFTGEKDADGVQKFTLGQFTDYWEADVFKKYLREMGVKDAWIVSYVDGVRVPLKDVLEDVI